MKLKCVVAEDAAFIREIYRLNLQNTGVEIVAEAGDGVEALRLAGEIRPDLLLLELVLPLKSGMDVLQALSAKSPHTKAIVISSLDDEAIVTRAKALGAVVYLKKPFTRAAFLKAVEDVSQSYGGVQNG